MKRPPELYEFLKSSGNVSDRRDAKAFLKYWRLRTPKQPAPECDEKATAAEPSRAEEQRSAPEPEPPPRDPAPEPASHIETSERSAARFVLSGRAMALAAALLVLLLSSAYLVGSGIMTERGNPALRLDRSTPSGSDTLETWTVQVFAWSGVGNAELVDAQTVVDFLKREGFSARIAVDRAAGETRVCVGQGLTKDDAELSKTLGLIRALQVKEPKGGNMKKLFEGAIVRPHEGRSHS